MNKDTPFLDGKPVKPSDSTIPVFGSTKPKTPTLKTEKETTGTAKISGTGKPLTAGAVSPTNCPLENKDAVQVRQNLARTHRSGRHSSNWRRDRRL